MTNLRKSALLAAIGAASLMAQSSFGGTFTANFNDNQTPAGATLAGNNPTEAGVIENGVLKLTKNVNGRSGSIVLDPLDPEGTPVFGFTFNARVLVGGGTATPADGFGVTFDPFVSGTPGHDGTGRGITVTFDQYNNGGDETQVSAPSIDVRVNGTVVATKRFTNQELRTTTATPFDPNGFAPLSITVTADGSVTVVYKGQTVFDHVYFAGYQPIVDGKFAVHANTGGLNENYWIDDISITTITENPQVAVVNPPQSQTVIPGTSVTFSPIVNNFDTGATIATLQWFKGDVAIEGATEAIYTTPALTLADSGAKYKLTVTGPNNTVTTPEATITVKEVPAPASPHISWNFNDGILPAGTVFGENLTLDPPSRGGHIGSAEFGEETTSFHLVDAINGQAGGLVLDSFDFDAPVHGIHAAFKVLVGGGSAVPADGWSFSWGPGITTPSGELENGTGNGLVVAFDIYNNLDFEAPAIEVRYAGQVVGQKKVPLSFITTGDQWADVNIRLENDGTIDVVFKGVVIFDNLLIPNFTSFNNARYAFAARTGGLNANMWIDDLSISSTTTAGAVRFISQPIAQMILPGQTATFSATVNDLENVTFQWLRNGAPIDGATEPTYTFTPVAGDSGVSYSLRATKDAQSVTTTPALLTIFQFTETVNFDFNSGTTAPAGTVVSGTTPPAVGPGPDAGYISANGGVADSGVLHLTDAFNGRQGAFVIEPLLSGAELAGFNAAFDLRLGGGSGNSADGVSFNFAPGLPTTHGTGQDGTGNGLRIAIDTYDNGGGEAPSVDVVWRGQVIAVAKLTKAEIKFDNSTDNSAPVFKTVIVKLSADGKVDVSFGGKLIHSQVQLPNYAPTAAGRFGFYAATGGLNENQWIDNVRIQALKTVSPLRITQDPANALIFAGNTVTFTAGVSDPEGVTFKWFRDNLEISGATAATYTTPVLTATDSGATFKLTATRGAETVTSATATVTVATPIAQLETADVKYNFDDGALPDGTTLWGRITSTEANPGVAGYITLDGGVDGGGVVHLTDANNGQGGAFYVRNLDGTEGVSAFTATWRMRIGGGSQVPADGAAFVWANNIDPDAGNNAIFGEDGIGNGLVVSFDIYHNDGEDAPEFELKWNGIRLAIRPVPLDWLTTGDEFANVVVRVEADGTVDVQYEDRPIFGNVPIPNFKPVVGAHFAIGARTGGLNANQWIDNVAIITTSVPIGPDVTLVKNEDGSITVNWTPDTGILQFAPSVTGPWNTVDGAVNGYTVTPDTSVTARFYRVAVPQ